MAKSSGRNSYTVGVKLLSNRSFSVMVGPLDTVAALKQRIFEREGIPPQQQNLLVMGKLLQVCCTLTLLALTNATALRIVQPDTRALSDYNLKAGDMVYVTAG
jgi:hypothetical protein